jgi:hypothetical protein
VAPDTHERAAALIALAAEQGFAISGAGGTVMGGLGASPAVS